MLYLVDNDCVNYDRYMPQWTDTLLRLDVIWDGRDINCNEMLGLAYSRPDADLVFTECPYWVRRNNSKTNSAKVIPVEFRLFHADFTACKTTNYDCPQDVCLQHTKTQLERIMFHLLLQLFHRALNIFPVNFYQIYPLDKN